jgi:hypothetical protein
MNKIKGATPFSFIFKKCSNPQKNIVNTIINGKMKNGTISNKMNIKL